MNHIIKAFNFVAVIVVALIASTMQGRFLEEDSDKIEGEAKSKEQYTDHFSYRFPYFWQRIWRQSLLGYRISAGSLDVNKFYINEQLKLKFSGSDDFRFWILRERQEDLVFQHEFQELNFWWRLGGEFWAAIVGEPGFAKKFSDIGIAVAYEIEPQKRIQLKYLEVDNPYNQKEDEGGLAGDPGIYQVNEMLRKPWTAEVNIDWQWLGGHYLAFSYEHDAPMRWHRYSEGYQYESQQNYYELATEYFLQKLFSLRTNAKYQVYHESKLFFVPPTNNCYEQNSKRHISALDIGGIYQYDTEHFLQSGMNFINRDFESSCLRVNDEQFSDQIRREYMPYVFFDMPLNTADKSRWQIGPIINTVTFPKNDRATATEVKLQLSFDLNFPNSKTDSFRVLINTGWDIDDVVTTFPYDDEPFLPWDGGNVQFMATF